MSGCKGSEESAILAPWGGKAAPITMHRQTSNNKPGGKGVNLSSSRLGSPCWTPGDGSGFRSTAERAPGLPPRLASCWIPHGRWRGTTTYLNTNELFHLGRIFMFHGTDPQAQFHPSVFRRIFTPARGYIYISASAGCVGRALECISCETVHRSGKPHIRWKTLT